MSYLGAMLAMLVPDGAYPFIQCCPDHPLLHPMCCNGAPYPTIVSLAVICCKIFLWHVANCRRSLSMGFPVDEVHKKEEICTHDIFHRHCCRPRRRLGTFRLCRCWCRQVSPLASPARAFLFYLAFFRVSKEPRWNLNAAI